MRARAVIVVAGALALPSLRSGRARADATVTVNLNAAGQTLAQDLGDGITELEQRVQDKINSLYQLENLDELLAAFGDGTAAADRGLGVDYAARAGELMVGFAATGADAGGPKLGSSSVSAGDIYNFGAFAGANLARFGLPRLTVFVNGYYETASVEQLTGHLTTLGAHAQWRALDGRPLSAHGGATWIGLDVTTGLEYAHDAVGATQGGIISHFTIDGDTAGESRNLTVMWTGTLNLVSSATTIPVIATTGLRLGALDVYVGGGVDLTFGKTTITAGLNGTMSTTDDMTPVGTVDITASASVTPSAAVLRGLAGLQLDVWHVHVYAQGDMSQTASAVTLGVRALFDL